MSTLSLNILLGLLTLAPLANAILDGTLGFDKSCTGIGSSYNFFAQDCRGASPIIMPKPCATAAESDSDDADDVSQPWTRDTDGDVKSPCDMSDFDWSEDVDCVGKWQKCGKDCGNISYIILREARGNGTACPQVDGFEKACIIGMDDCVKASSANDSADNRRRLQHAEEARRLQEDDSNAACYETNWFNPSIVERDVLVYDKTSLDSFLNVAIDIDGSFWGVKTGFSLDYAKSHIETKTGFSYMSTVTASTHKTTIRNARNMQLADSAKSLLASGPDGAKEFIDRYGTYYVSSFYWGSEFIGSSEYKTSFSDDQEKVKEEFGLGYKSIQYSIDVNQGLKKDDSKTSVSAFIKNYYQISGSLGQSMSSADEQKASYVQQKKCEWLTALRTAADTGKISSMDRITAIMRMDYRTWYDLEEVRQIVDQYGNQIVEMFNTQPPSELFFEWLAKETAHTWQSQQNVVDLLQWRCVDENPNLKDALTSMLSDIQDHQFAIESLSDSKLQVLWTQFSCSCSNLGQANCPSECPHKFTFFVAESGVYEDKIDELTGRYQCDERYISTMQLQTEPENQLYAIEKDTNFVYHDLSGHKGRGFDTWQWCATMCNRNPSCRAWSWHEPHDDNIAYRRHCYLKSSDAGRRKWLTDKQIWSGYRLSIGISTADVSVSNSVDIPELNMMLKRKSAIASGIQLITGKNSSKCSNQGPLVKNLGLIGYALTGQVPHAPEYHEVNGGDFIAGRTTQLTCPGNSFLTGLKISYNPTNGDKGPACVSGPACAAAVPRSIDLRCKTLPKGMYGPPRAASANDSNDDDSSKTTKKFWSIGQQTVSDCMSKCDNVAVPTNFEELGHLMAIVGDDKSWVGLHKLDNKLYTVAKGKTGGLYPGAARWKDGEGKNSSEHYVVRYGRDHSGLWFDVKHDGRKYQCICEKTVPIDAAVKPSGYGPLKRGNLRNVGERTNKDCFSECGGSGRVAVPYTFSDAALLLDVAKHDEHWIGLKKFSNVLYRDAAKKQKYTYSTNWKYDEGRESKEENVVGNPEGQWFDVPNDHRVYQCVCEEHHEGNQYTLSTTPTVARPGSDMWYSTTLDSAQELSCSEGDFITSVRVEEAGNCGGAYESSDFKETGQGSVMGKISITCRASSDYIVQDCVKVNRVQEGGWSLVRHVPTGNTWHRANDNLLGTETYGRPCGPKCKLAWSTRWSELDVEEFLFSSGDCDSWLAINAAQIYANFDNEDKYIVNSSNGKGNQAIRMDNRSDVPQDPMIALGDARSVTDDGSNLLYLENGFYGFRSGLTHEGQNVYVRGGFVEDDKRENDCFKPCGNKSGWCSWCGEGNACCMHHMGTDAEECSLLGEEDFRGVLDRHTCVKMPNTGDDNQYEDTTTDIDSDACFWSQAYPNKELSGLADTKTYTTLATAREACEDLGHVCGGVTLHSGNYELRTNTSPVATTGGEMSWVKETCVTDYIVMSLSVETEQTFIVGAYALLTDAEARLAQLQGQNPRLICETYGPSVGDPRNVDGKPTQGSAEFNVYWRSSQDIAKMMDHCKNRNDFKTYRVVSKDFGVLSGTDGTLAAAKAKRATLLGSQFVQSIICTINADGTVEQPDGVPADEIADLLAQCEQRSAGCWAKVHSGCERDPASGFSTRWKKIMHFNGKARECGLLAKGLENRCGANPGEVEMKYVSGM